MNRIIKSKKGKMEIMECVWVCQFCGKVAKDRCDFEDESCFLNSVLCYKDSLEYDDKGRVINAKPVKD